MMLTAAQQKEQLICYLFFLGFDDIKIVQKVFIQDQSIEDLTEIVDNLRKYQHSLQNSFTIYINEDEDEKIPDELISHLNQTEPDIYIIWLNFFSLLPVTGLRIAIPDQKIFDIKSDMKKLITHPIERINEFITKSSYNVKMIQILTQVRQKVNELIIDLYYQQAEEQIFEPYQQQYMGVLSPKLLKYCVFLIKNSQQYNYWLPNIQNQHISILKSFGRDIDKKIQENGSIKVLLNEIDQIIRKEAEKNDIIKQLVLQEENAQKVDNTLFGKK